MPICIQGLSAAARSNVQQQPGTLLQPFSFFNLLIYSYIIWYLICLYQLEEEEAFPLSFCFSWLFG
jgi:hypothetical protein